MHQPLDIRIDTIAASLVLKLIRLSMVSILLSTVVQLVYSRSLIDILLSAISNTKTDLKVTHVDNIPPFQVSLEFHLSHCLDLVKAGMESIIEDQVTSVFEAEELRSWNLLTRTNR